MSAHENLARTDSVKGSGNRAFGWVFTVAFLAIGMWPLVTRGAVRPWALLVSAVLLVLTIAAPALLAVPNRAWQRVGALLHRCVSPLVLLFLFYAVITPMGVLMRSTSGGGHRWRTDRDKQTYWIGRVPPGPPADSLRNQF